MGFRMAHVLIPFVAAGLAALAVAPTAAATSSGMSADFPVGVCIDAPKQFVFNPVDGNLMRNEIGNLVYSTPVPCTDPGRDYRVVAQVVQDGLCGPETSNVFHTRDVRVLCAVDDVPSPRG